MPDCRIEAQSLEISEETLFNLEDILCFYALGYKCQLHPHLSVALAVSSHTRSMLSRCKVPWNGYVFWGI
jgi:hypothetical protein